ncbi:MAG: hypothetical protein LBC27_03670 [Spirochaetaceae bacterium]|jgi:hypothetical protein|nr:hypothetical protein [Spirochaetaceae bacterium]
MWQNLKSLIAFVCIFVYIAAAAFSGVQIYKAVGEQRFEAQQEFADLADFAGRAGALGIFTNEYIEDIKTQLDMSKAIDALIIYGPDNNKAAFEKRPGLISYKGDYPGFNEQAKFYRSPQTSPLRMENSQTVSISAFSPLINFNKLLAVLRASLLAILIAVVIAFSTLIVDVSLVKNEKPVPQGSSPPPPKDAALFDSGGPSFSEKNTLPAFVDDFYTPSEEAKKDVFIPVEEALVEETEPQVRIEDFAPLTENVLVDEDASSTPVEETMFEDEDFSRFLEEKSDTDEDFSQSLEETPVDEEDFSEYGEGTPVESGDFSQSVKETPVDNEDFSQSIEETPVDEEGFSQSVEETLVEDKDFPHSVEETPVDDQDFSQLIEETPVDNEDDPDTLAEAELYEEEPPDKIGTGKGLLATANAMYETDNFGDMDDNRTFLDELKYELRNAEAEDKDLTLLSIEWTASGLQEEVLVKQTAAFFKDGGRVFEREAQGGVYVILQGMDLDKVFTDAKEFHRRARELTPQNTYLELLMGISARSGRNVSAVTLLNEAECALEKARSDSALPIVAFKADPQKYKEFKRKQKKLF